MANTIQLVLFCIGVTLATCQQDCKYWCKNPETLQYDCCDNGNPFTEAPDTDTKTGESSSGAAVTDSDDVVIEGESTGCLYYCAYGGSVYCCHEAGKPMPQDHNENGGRCAVENEQVCKNGISYLGGKAFTKGKAVKLGSHDNDVCASDGYCQEDEKCCINVCAKKHTCMKAIYEETKE